MFIYTSIVLIITFVATISAGDLGLAEGLQSCVLPDDQEDRCSTICYPTIKPLLKHVASCHQNKEIVVQLQDKIREQEIDIKRLKLENDIIKDRLEEYKKSAVLNNQLNEALDHNRNIVSHLNAKLSLLIRLNTTDDPIRQLNEETLLLRQRNRELEEMANGKEPQLQDLPSSCLGFKNDQGIRRIKVPGSSEFDVLCDSKTAGPGWTVVLRNLGDENFNRNWTDYEFGFGFLESSFFRGLEVLNMMTQSQPHELYMVVYFKDDSSFSNYFDNIVVGSESEGYRLASIGNPKSEDLLFIKRQVNAKFSTYDRNNANTETNYAAQKQAGWWFSRGSQLSLTSWPPNAKQILMLIRPKM